jgi:hypothetical protein
VQPVLSVEDVGADCLRALLARYGLAFTLTATATEIPGSYWGEREAGLIGNVLHGRLDTPIHSVLHEAAHYVCMDGARRKKLERDAGGDYDEENAACYLQILLADHIHGCGRERMCADMDAWGYTFRLSSARAWFEHDAQDAREWLEARRITERGAVTWRLRD